VTLTKSDAINDNGWIVADGTDRRTGQTHGKLPHIDTGLGLPTG